MSYKVKKVVVILIVYNIFVTLLNTLMDVILLVGLGHVIQHSACICAHGDVCVAVHTPIVAPLIADDPIALSTGVVVSTVTATIAVAIFSILIIARDLGECVANNLNTMIHIYKRGGATEFRCNDTTGVVLPE
jgi:hypothetical protein